MLVLMGSDCRAAGQRDEVAPFQLIELHSVTASQGRIVEYRIGITGRGRRLRADAGPSRRPNGFFAAKARRESLSHSADARCIA
jgi:hypothetical protein